MFITLNTLFHCHVQFTHFHPGMNVFWFDRIWILTYFCVDSFFPLRLFWILKKEREKFLIFYGTQFSCRRATKNISYYSTTSSSTPTALQSILSVFPVLTVNFRYLRSNFSCLQSRSTLLYYLVNSSTRVVTLSGNFVYKTYGARTFSWRALKQSRFQSRARDYSFWLDPRGESLQFRSGVMWPSEAGFGLGVKFVILLSQHGISL